MNKNTKKDKKIYLLPGRRTPFTKTPGKNLTDMGYLFMGRELVGEFEYAPISHQLSVICDDIKKYFWSKDSVIIGRSYGGYLAMHTLIEFLPLKYPGRVLLLSPVLGRSPIINGYMSRPPRSERILDYAKSGKLEGLDIEIHTGKLDKGCDYKLAQEIFSYIKSSKLTIVEDADHYLSYEYTNLVLKNFLENN